MSMKKMHQFWQITSSLRGKVITHFKSSSLSALSVYHFYYCLKRSIRAYYLETLIRAFALAVPDRIVMTVFPSFRAWNVWVAGSIHPTRSSELCQECDMGSSMGTVKRIDGRALSNIPSAIRGSVVLGWSICPFSGLLMVLSVNNGTPQQESWSLCTVKARKW